MKADLFCSPYINSVVQRQFNRTLNEDEKTRTVNNFNANLTEA